MDALFGFKEAGIQRVHCFSCIGFLHFYPIQVSSKLYCPVLLYIYREVNGCYRNGLVGGRGMRSFSCLYFIMYCVVFH